MKAPFKLTPVKIEPRKIDFDFRHYAVCVSPDFSDIDIIPAHIHHPETVKCLGIVPGTTRFDRYEDERVAITLDLHGFNALKIAIITNQFAARPVLADKPGIYETSDRASNIGELFGRGYTSSGVFKTADDARKAIAEKRSEYIAALQKKLDSVLPVDTIAQRFNVAGIKI